MKILTAFLVWAVVSAGCAFADDFKLSDGREYKGVTVTRVEPDGLMVMTDSGIEKLLFALLPKDVQQKYHYNPAAAAAQEAQAEAARQYVHQVQQQDLQSAAAATQQAQQAPDAPTVPRVRIIGTVEESDQDGLLVDTNIEEWVSSGGNVVLARDKSRPKLGPLQEEIYLIGHPKQSEIVNKNGVDVDAVPDGTYMSPTGKIRQFKVTTAYKDPFR